MPDVRPADPRGSSVCTARPDEREPVQLDAAAAARTGATARTLRDLTTTPAAPVEVCGRAGEEAWLLRITCADTTTPLVEEHRIAKARVGSAGRGGRCGSVIDHYVVPCPEATYDVYMDMYMCGPGEAFR